MPGDRARRAAPDPDATARVRVGRASARPGAGQDDVALRTARHLHERTGQSVVARSWTTATTSISTRMFIRSEPTVVRTGQGSVKNAP